jgi:signal transduction histidine kinase
MSHELRTPLNAIVGYSELLQEEAVDLNDPTILQDVEKIYISGKYMLSLTDGILDLSKIKAGKIELHSETCKLSHVLEEVISIVTPLLRKNGNSLKVDYPEEIGTMQTDVTRLHQILFNLLNNANESTEQGEIRLEVSRDTIDKKEWVRFAVSDSGGGMTIEQRQWLLRILSKGAVHERSADEEEVGFALAISSHFWKMMGGELDIHSEPNRGSTFILRLPAHPERS